MSKTYDKLWIWGTVEGMCNIPIVMTIKKRSYMSAMEAALYMGAENMFIATYGDQPQPRWDRTARALTTLKSVKWAVVGADAASYRSDMSDEDVDELLRIAPDFPNITGAFVPDYFDIPTKKERYTKEKLAEIKARTAEKGLDFWCEYAEGKNEEYLENADGVFYIEKDVNLSTEEFEKKLLCFFEKTKGKKRLAGLWFTKGEGEKLCEISLDNLKSRLCRIKQAIDEGEAEGLILAPSSVMDVDLKSVEFTREWIRGNL